MNKLGKQLLSLSLMMAMCNAPIFAAPDDHHDDHDHDTVTEKTESKDPLGHEEGHTDEVTLSAEAIKQYGVVVGTAKRQSIQSSFVAPARVSFNTDAMAHVGSSVTGRSTELKVKLGDLVKKGDVLLIVDSPELGEAQSDYLVKHATVETAKRTAQLTKDTYERAKQLMDQSQGIALSEVQKREAELHAAEGNLRGVEAGMTAAENKLHLYGMSQEMVAQLVKSGEIVPQYRVIAPLDGQVIEREVTLGELVRPDRDALMVLADLSTLWVIADVPEARIASVSKGSLAKITVSGLKAAALEGRVTYIAPALDPNTRSAKARIEIQDPSGTLKPGMFAQVTLMPPANTDEAAVLAIPEVAVQIVEGGPAVFVPVKDEPGTFAKRAVKIGPPIGGMVQVFEGLTEDEALVVSGSFILKAELGKAGAAHEH